MSERRDLFGLFCKSLSPSIFGHELVKAGQILCLFGGTDKRNKRNEEIFCREDARYQKEGADNNIISSNRPDIHLLMVGEAGLGKSQMLKNITSISPRGVYVSGNQL